MPNCADDRNRAGEDGPNDSLIVETGQIFRRSPTAGHDDHLGAAIALLCGYGLIHGVRGATSSALGLQLGEAYRGTMMALRASVVQLGYVLGGLFGGMLLERWGFPALAIAYAAFLVTSGLSTWRGIPGAR